MKKKNVRKAAAKHGRELSSAHAKKVRGGIARGVAGVGYARDVANPPERR